MSKSTLAVDVMSGDFGPSVLVPACVDFLKHNSLAKLILVGDEKVILGILGAESGTWKPVGFKFRPRARLLSRMTSHLLRYARKKTHRCELLSTWSNKVKLVRVCQAVTQVRLYLLPSLF